MTASRPTRTRRATLARAALLLPLFVALLALPGQAGAATPRDIPPPPPTIAVPGQTAAVGGPAVQASHASVSQAQSAAPLAPASAPNAPTPPPTVPPPPSPTPPATPTGTPTLPPNSSGTNLSLSPTHGLTDTVLALNGTGFGDNQDIHIRWDGQGGDMPAADGASAPKTDDNGHFYTKVAIPRDAALGGHEIAATDGHKMAYALVQVDPAPTNTPDNGLCVSILGATLCIPTPSSIMYGLANNITHFWGNVFSVVTAPFNAALTYSPDLTQQPSLSGIRQMQQQLSTAAGGLLVFFLTIGVLAGYLTAIGRGQFQALLAPVGRAIFVTGVVAGYSDIMSKGFGIVGAFAAGINGISVGASETGFDALGHAFGTITDLFTIIGVVKGFVVFAGVLVSILAVIIRYTALGFLDLLYTIGPICLVTYVSPQFSFIARWWWRTFLGLALYPVAYALVLKVIANVLIVTTDVGGAVTGVSAFDQTNGMVAALGSLGLVLMIYRVPALVGSLVGGGASVFGSASSAITDAGIAAGVSLATRGVGDRLFRGRQP